MKKSITTILLLTSLLSYSQLPDTICLPKRTYLEIYKGLKAKEHWRDAALNNANIAKELRKEQERLTDTITYQLGKLEEANYELDYLNYQREGELKSQRNKWALRGAALGTIIGTIIGLIVGIIIK